MPLADLDSTFALSLARSVTVGFAVAFLSLLIGWPLGVRLGTTTFPFRRALFALLALPLLLPSFLIAIGLSMHSGKVQGPVAVVWVFLSLAAPLVTYAALAATYSLTRGQVESALLAGGESRLFCLSMRAAFPLAALAASLSGVFTLSDPGPGQILGWHGAASELLTSFASRYDRSLATTQAAYIAIVPAVIALPIVFKLAPAVAAGLFARDVARPSYFRRPSTALFLCAVVIVFTIIPITGLFRPFIESNAWPLERAWGEVQRTIVDSILYAAIAAIAAVAAAFVIALAGRKSPGSRRVVVTFALALLAVPPALLALWLVPWSGRVVLGVALGLRGLPIAILLGLRALGSMPSSWVDAAHVHRVPYATFVARVVGPWCWHWASSAAALTALLAMAEIGMVLLLHPPGHANLPLAIFTIMANAPESLVAALCLFYVALALAVSMIALRFASKL